MVHFVVAVIMSLLISLLAACGSYDFKVNERFSLIGDWTRYEFDTSESDVISIGFKFVF